MRQSDLDAVLKDVCPDQLEAFRRFVASGDLDAAATDIHFQACGACADALDALIAHREKAKPEPEPGAPPRNVAKAAAVIAIVITVVLTAFATLVICLANLVERHTETMTAAERTASRVRYVRMPGRPETCVATLPGTGAFGPTFIGAAACSQVQDRVEFDEEASFRLGQLEIVPIDGTTDCLALGPDGDGLFTFRCSIADDD